MQINNIVSIAFCVDSNYIQHLTATLYSLCDNLEKGRVLHVYVVYNALLQSDQDRLIQDMSSFQNVNILFIEDKYDYQALSVDTSMTVSTYLKINLINTLPKSLTKVLYIDCDIIALGDIGELYDLDPKYLMAVRDTHIYLEKYYDALFGVRSKNGYFNAGVMLMNLSALRGIGSAEKMMEYSIKFSEFFHWHDQTGFNYLLYDKYEQIHPKYNLLQSVYSIRDMRQSIYPESEYKEAKMKPTLIHYSGGMYKPWNYEAVGPYKYLYSQNICKTSYANFSLKYSFKKVLRKGFHYFLLFILPIWIIRILIRLEGYRFLQENKKNIRLIHSMISTKDK